MGSITNNRLYIECKTCGHSKTLAVKTLIARFGMTTQVRNLTSKMRCENCKAKGNVEFRIIYIGGSGEAMLGASQLPGNKRPKPS